MRSILAAKIKKDDRPRIDADVATHTPSEPAKPYGTQEARRT